MSSDRLRHVEQQLQILQEQQNQLEQEILLENGLQKIQLEQTLRLKTKPQIRQYKEEYWQILADESETTIISEPAPEVVVAEILEQVGQLQTSQQYSDEMLEWLQKIYAEVSKTGAPAAAKLKGVVSLMPPFVNLSYEAEFDTENFWRTHCPTYTRWYKALAKKLSPSIHH